MIVTLTFHQGRSVAHRVSSLHRRTMLQHRTKRGRTQHDYDLPAIAWRQILDEMQRACFGPMGGKLDRGVPKSAYSAIRRIADAVRRIENHPALKARAVEGWVGDIVPAWPDGPPLSWTCYPTLDGPIAMHLFVPKHETVNGMEVTTWWSAAVGAAGWSGEPRTWTLRAPAHQMFVGRTATPDLEAELLADEFEFEDLVSRQTFGATDRGRVEDV